MKAIDDIEETRWQLVIYEPSDTIAGEPRVKAEMRGETKRHRIATDAQRDSTRRESIQKDTLQRDAEVSETKRETKEPSQWMVRSGILIIAGMIAVAWFYRKIKRN